MTKGFLVNTQLSLGATITTKKFDSLTFLLTFMITAFLSIGSAAQAKSPATNPVPRQKNYDWMSIEEWNQQHQHNVETAAAGDVEVLFLGDSITNGWTWADNPKIFKAAFGAHKTANFGIGGDQTQNLLWRLKNGEVGKLDPRVVVLMIGVNNLGNGQHKPDIVVEGVQAVVNEVKKHFKHARILLLGLLPYDYEPSSESRVKVAQVNRQLALMNDDKTVFYYDFGALFVDERGRIPALLMEDYLHPTHLGYSKLAEKLGPVVDELMQ